MTDYLIIYLAVINLIAIIFTISDKKRAQKDRWRIKESTLISLALFGGAVGEYLTMKLIRHKTKHAKFMIGLPAIIILHIAVSIFVYLKVAQFI